MTVVDELIATLGYELEGEANLRKFKSGLDETEQSARAASARLKRLGAAAGVAATAVAAVGVKGFREFASFERQLSRIGITAEASVEEIARAGDALQHMAMETALPIEEAISGLDTLVSVGMSLEEAMAFLPSVLVTAQAAGAAVNDIANTAEKTASALKIPAEEMQKAFDIMVAGGKAGQFELRDMAQYIPELANSFASLGFGGHDGLQRLIALLQTVREDTGSASAAATQLRNVFLKMYSEETAKRFSEFGIDLRSSLQEANEAGEDVVQTFVRLADQAIDGDLSKLPLLFRDAELQLGMQSLITSTESFSRFLDEVNGAKIEGEVFKDFNRITNDSQANLDRLSNKWDEFWAKLGGRIAPTINPVLESGIEWLENDSLIESQLESEGVGWWRRNVFITPGEREEALERARTSQLFGGDDTPTAPTTEVLSPPAAGLTATDAIERLSLIVPESAVEAAATDARQDNRDQTTVNNITINQTVTQPTEAPDAAAQATERAVVRAASTQRTQIEAEPAF